MKIALNVHSSSRFSLVAALSTLALLSGACGSSSGASTADGGSPDGGSPDGGSPDGGGSGGDNAKFNFETDVQGWSSPTGAFTNISTSSAQKSAGAKSLVGTITTTVDNTSPYTIEAVFMGTLPTIAGNSKATFHVYIPTGSSIMAFQPYLNEGDLSDPQYRFTSTWTVAMPGTWQTVEVTAPLDVTPLLKVGVQFFANADWTGQVYIDSVDWK